jgi:hypothetical protein
MKPHERRKWLYNAIKGERGGVDVLYADFVDAYMEATGAKCYPQMWGAHKCPQLGRDLSQMARDGALRRHRAGLSGGAWQPGFPKWVWSYEIGRGHTAIWDEIYKEEQSA